MKAIQITRIQTAAGILPESPSFSDKGIGEIPQRWKGVCMRGSQYSNNNFCNRKIIGARYYSSSSENISSPRDYIGHGTHTASTAAGTKVGNASYFGLGKGTARGGLTGARIAAYKACSETGCGGSFIMKAIDDAVKDGVDIISISIGMGSSETDFSVDPIAIGAFHAHQKGVMVVCSAGNSGPKPSTVVNTAPWLLTVAASNIDRDFLATVILGNGMTFKGPAISLSGLSKSSKYPLAFAGDLAADFTPPSEASNCMPVSLDAKRVAGKIIVCMNTNSSISRRIAKLTVEDGGAIGLLYVSEISKGLAPFGSGTFPFVQLGVNVGLQILNYIKSSINRPATILPAVTVPRSRPAPVVADFSSRGPGPVTENILNPDIMAPGVAILAATVPKNGKGDYPVGQKPSKFGLGSGTSMACPHVTGAAALIKSVHRGWTPSMIKSALMTTAITSDNMGRELRNGTGEFASPHEVGVGEISPFKALDPGMVFVTTTEEYRYFLCYFGYSNEIVRDITLKTKFRCPKESSESLISNINYPTISIGEMKRRQKRTIKRRVTNVGSPNSRYIVTVRAPQGLKVNVSPKEIVFGKSLTKASFNVTFSQAREEGYKFGSLTWSDGKHEVRVVFAVNVV